MKAAHPSAEAAAKDDPPSFEDVVSRLGAIVLELDRGDLPLERSLALFEEGVRLARLGNARLDAAEARVDELLSTGRIEPLSPDAPAAPAAPTSERKPR